MKDCVLVVEPVSTGFNYLPDAVDMGYQPIALFPRPIGTDEEIAQYEEAHRSACRRRFPAGTIVIEDTGDYDALLAEIKKYPVVCVVVGSELGAGIGDQIAHDLGLPGNPTESSLLHRDKDKMQQRLKERNLPYIRGELIYSVEEAEAFLERYGLDAAVVKPTDGAGSIGVHLCHGREEILAAVKKSLSGDKRMAISSENGGTLIQELLVGTEYIVDTISRNGVHYISDIWSYDRIPIANGKDGNAYNSIRFVTKVDAREYEMCRYALQVVEALDIKYGPTHGEYMLTDHGPVLIELGARPLGAGMSREFLNRLLGHHVTDRSLAAYFNEELFESHLRQPYRPLSNGLIKMIIMENDTDFDNVPLLSIVSNLQSVMKTTLGEMIAGGRVARTVDLDTNGGMIFLCHEDSRVIEHDYSVLRSLELSLPELLYSQSKGSEGKVFDENEMAQSLEKCPISGKTLLFLPDDNAAQKYKDTGMDVVTMDTVFSAKGEYERIFIWVKGLDSAPEDMVAAVFALLKLLVPGGAAVIPEISVSDSPVKAELIAVLEANNVSVQVPNYLTEDYIIGRK